MKEGRGLQDLLHIEAMRRVLIHKVSRGNHEGVRDFITVYGGDHRNPEAVGYLKLMKIAQEL